jgi:TPP-dependent pyruvate/acetoin dehydrogenase alpha subunit
VTGHWYSGVGEEAASVGAFWAAARDDVCCPHYRCALVVHHLRGRPLEDIFAALLSKRDAASRGRHLPPFDGYPEGNVLPYVSVMLGPQLAVAAGAALAFKHRGEPRVAIVGFGDGTAGTGDFHETLNMSASLSLPIVFYCQNNQFSISTRPERTLAGESIAAWAERYGMPATRVDGNHAPEVVAAMRAAITRARERGGPSCVEMITYRRTGHFVADPAHYRGAEELAQWKQRDPLTLCGDHLCSRHGASRDHLGGIAAAAEHAVREARRAAQQRPPWTADDLDLGGVYERAY